MMAKFKKINKYKLNYCLIKEALKETNRLIKWVQLNSNNKNKKEERNSINSLKILQI